MIFIVPQDISLYPLSRSKRKKVDYETVASVNSVFFPCENGLQGVEDSHWASDYLLQFYTGQPDSLRWFVSGFGYHFSAIFDKDHISFGLRWQRHIGYFGIEFPKQYVEQEVRTRLSNGMPSELGIPPDTVVYLKEGDEFE